MKESGNCPLAAGRWIQGRRGREGWETGWHLRSTCFSGEGLKISPWVDEGWGALKGLPLLGCWQEVGLAALPEESGLYAFSYIPACLRVIGRLNCWDQVQKNQVIELRTDLGPNPLGTEGPTYYDFLICVLMPTWLGMMNFRLFYRWNEYLGIFSSLVSEGCTEMDLHVEYPLPKPLKSKHVLEYFKDFRISLYVHNLGNECKCRFIHILCITHMYKLKVVSCIMFGFLVLVCLAYSLSHKLYNFLTFISCLLLKIF